MLTKTARIRLIINAGERTLAQKIADEIIHRLSGDAKVTAEIVQYEDEHHYDITFAFNLSAENLDLLEYKSYLICTKISTGPWLFVTLPSKENEFEFEAIFNHEAFIHHSTEYSNKLKWAHLEIN